MTAARKRDLKATGRFVSLLGLGQAIDALDMPDETRNSLRVGYFAVVMACGELKVLEAIARDRPESIAWITQAAAWVDAEVAGDPGHFLAAAHAELPGATETPAAAGKPG